MGKDKCERLLCYDNSVIDDYFDGLFLPNENNNFSGIEKCVNFIIVHGLEEKVPEIYEWLAARISRIEKYETLNVDELIKIVMSLAEDELPSQYIDSIGCEILRVRRHLNLKKIKDVNELNAAKSIIRFIRQNYILVKEAKNIHNLLNGLYFIVYSNGVNWRPSIERYLFNRYIGYYFKENPPNYVWVGHSREIKGGGAVLFEGSWDDLIKQLQDLSIMWY